MAKKISKNATYDINALSEAFNSFYEEDEKSLENFKLFLQANKLSTLHAEEIFEFYKNDKNSLSLEKNSFKIRKTHPKRDTFVKKVVIPTAITSAAIGAVASLIAVSGLIGGSTVLGIIPVSATPGLTTMATAIVGAGAGLALTPTIIAIKGAITKTHYKAWYKSAKSNLKAYKSGVDVEALPIKTLMDRIENTNHKILKTKTGSLFTAPFRFARRHTLNVINRNRIHHVEAYTKDLVKMYHSIERNNFSGKEEAIKPIYDLLKQVDDFVSRNVLESKLHTLLTCKDSSKHTHKSTIENVDIFANLKTYVDAMAKAQLKEVKTATAQSKKNVKNIANKKLKANEIINGERLIARLVARYEAEHAPTVEKLTEEAPIVMEPVVKEAIKEPIEATLEEIIEEFKEVQVVEETVEKTTKEVKEEIVEEITPIAYHKNDLISHWLKCVQEGNYDYLNALLSGLNETISRDKTFYELSGKGIISISSNFYADVLANDPDFKNQSNDVVNHYGEMAKKTDHIHKIVKDINKKAEQARKQAIAKEEAKAKKVTPKTNLVVKTAQRLSYETRPITTNGDVVGTTLKINSNGETEKVEIRYMSRTKQIRVKTTGADNVVAQRYLPLRDNTIPPIHQMNDILREVAEDKHISNVDDLIIEL